MVLMVLENQHYLKIIMNELSFIWDIKFELMLMFLLPSRTKTLNLDNTIIDEIWEDNNN